jgi:glycosyltransferase involved in cell wall biosynthesis
MVANMDTLPISVLVDTYNHERFIEEAIVSVLEQDFPPAEMEILVIDDGSTDRTAEIVRKFAPRVRYLRKENGGQASAFNFGVPKARGEIIAFLDGDDWWAQNKLRLVMAAFEKNPDAGTVGHGIIEFDSAADSSASLTPELTGYFDLASSEGAQIFRNFMAFLGTSRVSIRKRVLEKVLPVPDALIVEADEFISTMAVAHDGAVLLPEPLTYYRLHDDNLFQFRVGDPIRMRRKMDVLACLASELPAQLARIGITASAISIVVEPIRTSVSRMRLMLDGGMPWETYRVERDGFEMSYESVSLGYRIYKELSLLLALFLPPRLYYKFRASYAKRDLRRFRSWLGEPVPRAQVTEVLVNSGVSTGADK